MIMFTYIFLGGKKGTHLKERKTRWSLNSFNILKYSNPFYSHLSHNYGLKILHDQLID